MEELDTNSIPEKNYNFFTIIIFIIIANVVGTNVFIPSTITLQFALEIWTWSMFANLVFITTMSISLIYPLEYYAQNGGIFGSGLLCGIMVYVGYMISWFWVCALSDEIDMEYYSIVFQGYWGAIACMFTSMVIMSKMNPEYLEYRQKNSVKCPTCNVFLTVPKNYSSVIKCTECGKDLTVLGSGGLSNAATTDLELPPLVK